MPLTFRGGLHVKEFKITKDSPIQKITPPKTVKIPMLQHIGVHCTPTVKKGDKVDMGQIVGVVEYGLGCPVHASISGVVKDIISVNNAQGVPIKTVLIENDFENRLSPDIVPSNKRYDEYTREELILKIKNAGISGMGGATFPTYAKIESALGKAKTIIINCAECEPYITCDHRLLLEMPEKVIGGIEVLLYVTGAEKAIIAIENNKPDAIEKLSAMVKFNPKISISVLKTKYPQGDERQIIYSITKKQVPHGKLPADIGFVIFNAMTASAVFDAYKSGMPLIERVVTVTGDCVKNPSNVLVPLGTSLMDVIDFCGGFIKEPKKIITGGPMMGQAQWDREMPVQKGTSAIIALSYNSPKDTKMPSVCIHCGKCVTVCPMYLMPLYLAEYGMREDLENCEYFDVFSCVECGCCSYICPGNVPIVQYIRVAKAKINEKRRAQRNNTRKGDEKK